MNTTYIAHKITTGTGHGVVSPCDWCDEPSAWLVVEKEGNPQIDALACDVHARQWFPSAFPSGVSLAKITDGDLHHSYGTGYFYLGELRKIAATMPLVREGLERNNLRALDVTLSLLAN